MSRRYYSTTALRTTLSSSCTSGATSLVVASVSGFPATTPYTLIVDADTVNEEIVEVTSRSGTTLTVTRGVDGSSAVAHSSGATVQHGVSARDFDEANAHVNATSDVHGVSGSLASAISAKADSSATTAALALKAPLASPTFTGTVTLPTATAVSPTAAGSTGVRQITISTSDPSGGSDGDIWVKYV